MLFCISPTQLQCDARCLAKTWYYLLTPWCRVLLEKLTGLQLVKKFPAFHGTRRFITALTSVRHLYLPWAHPIQSIYPHPTSWRSILILSTFRCFGINVNWQIVSEVLTTSIFRFEKCGQLTICVSQIQTQSPPLNFVFTNSKVHALTCSMVQNPS